MIQTALDPSYKLRIGLRPVKITYLVSPSDAAAIRGAMERCCTQWGGIRNLLAPVEQGNIAPFYSKLISASQPDWFVSYLDPAENAGIAERLYELCPGRRITIRKASEFDDGDESMSLLSPLRPEDCRDAIGLSLSGGLRKRVCVPNVLPAPSHDWVTLALYGTTFPDATAADGLPVVLPIRPDPDMVYGSFSFWESQQRSSPFTYPLNLTGYGIKYHSSIGLVPTSNTFEVVLVHRPADICYFWSLRAVHESTRWYETLGRRVLLLPLDLVDDSKALQSLVDLVRRVFPDPNVSSNLHLSFHAPGRETEIISALAKLPELERFSGEREIRHGIEQDSPRIRGDLSRAPLTYAFFQPKLPDCYRERVSVELPTRIQLSFGRNELRFTPDPGFQNRDGGAAAIDFYSDVWDRHPVSAACAVQAFPRNQPGGHQLGTPGMCFGALSTVIYPAPDVAVDLAIEIADEWAALAAYFAERGYQIRRSKDGQYADGLVELIGGMKAVELLANPVTYLILDILALRSSKKVAQRLGAELNATGDKLQELRHHLDVVECLPELKGIVKTLAQLKGDPRLKHYKADLLTTIDRLVKARILKRGFFLPCPQCGSPDWYPLGNLREDLLCTGCSHQFVLPVEHPSGREVEWEYRLNTLVNRAMDQDVLPNLLALHYVVGTNPRFCKTIGLELVSGNSCVREFDFVCSVNGRLIGGECKTGAELGDKDIETGRHAASLGFHDFFYCTMQKGFTADSQGRVGALSKELGAARSPMLISVLTSEELLERKVLTPQRIWIEPRLQ